jgi:hypothetical protein
VQRKLDKLASEKSFWDLVQHIAEKHHLVDKDMMSCLKAMYHSFSKDMHGSEEHVYIRMRDVTSPAERAVLAAIFEHQSMPYVVVDEEGSELTPCRGTGPRPVHLHKRQLRSAQQGESFLHEVHPRARWGHRELVRAGGGRVEAEAQVLPALREGSNGTVYLSRRVLKESCARMDEISSL